MNYVIDKKILLIRTVGNALVLLSLVGMFYTFWPVGTAFVKNGWDKFLGHRFEAAAIAGASNPTETFGSLLGKQDPNLKILVPKDPNFSIIVEKIGADAPVIPNVDASSKETYTAALKRGVAHALGTSFPGQPGVS